MRSAILVSSPIDKGFFQLKTLLKKQVCHTLSKLLKASSVLLEDKTVFQLQLLKRFLNKAIF